MGLLLSLLSELVAPSRCAACDSLVAPRLLFCAACDVAVLRAGPQPRGQHAVFAYGGAIATAIVRLKYAGRFDLAARFGPVMAGALAPDGLDVVVPVPLHPSRLAERGFDQAALLAGPVARGLRLPFASRALVRTRATPRQASLDRAARTSNVEAAFVCARPRAVAGRRVLLVDDVRTTGATLAACASALLVTGAATVVSLVLASRDRAENSEGGGRDDG
jgi:ComF family protein